MKKYDVLVSLGIFALACIVYFFTAAPGLMFTDSGELAAACSLLNVAHPTGYPLFTLQGHIWTMINPLPRDITWLNLLAGVYTATSVWFFYGWMRTLPEILKLPRLSGKAEYIVPAVGAAAYAFALTIWMQATTIEVYSLQLLIFTSCLYFFFKALSSEGSQSRRYLLVSGLTVGLGFANHGTTVLLIPGLLFLFFKRPGERFNFSKERFRMLLLILIPVLMGIALYLYLPIRSAMSPPINWGEVHRGTDKFFYHVLGKQYSVMMFTGVEAVKTNLSKFFSLLPYQLGFVGILSAIAGMIYCFKKSGTVAWFFIVIFVTCLFYALNYDIHDIDAYFSLAFIVLLAFSFLGLYALAARFPKISTAFILLPVISLLVNYSDCDESGNMTVDTYTQIVLENLEEDAVVISSQWDYWVSAFWYLQEVEGVRPDIVLFEMELVRRTWYRNQIARQYPEFFEDIEAEYDDFLQELEVFESDGNFNPRRLQVLFERIFNTAIAENIDSRPVYATVEVLQRERGIAKDYAKKPVGAAIKIEKDNRYVPTKPTPELDARFRESVEGKKGHLYEGILSLHQSNRRMVAAYRRSMASR